MHTKLRIVLLIAFSAKTCTPSHAQILHATGDRPSFEVATIKPWKPTPPPPSPPPDGTNIPGKIMKMSPVGASGQSSDRVHMILPADLLIASAYNLPVGSEHRRIFGPDWLHHDEQYEIQAKIEDSLFAAMQRMAPPQQHEQVQLMEQSLLADRFKLKVHFEIRQMPVYALIVAKSGAKLTRAKDGEPSKLVTLRTEQGSELVATAVTLSDFALSPLLTGPAGVRPVIDQTGLKGTYDFNLKWNSEQLAVSAANEDTPALFTAIQEQLGLKLVPSIAPVEVVVVDSIERPSSN